MRVQDLPLYAYKVFKDEPSGEYVAECLEIPGLSGIGETESEAIGELKEAIAGWLEVIEEDGLPFPQPLFDVKGDFILGGIRSSMGTTATTEVSSLQGNYPTVSIEQSRQEGKPQPGTSLHL